MTGVEARPHRDSGFSLLEVIVALALLALLMALLPPALRLAKRTSEFAIRLGTTSATATSIVTVERLLREASPQIERDKTGALKIAFDGQRSSLSFVAPLSDGPHGACLCRFRLAAVTADGSARREVVLTSEPWVASDASLIPDRVPAQKRTLTLDAGDVSFRFFGIGPGQQNPQWHETWLRKDRLPDLVEIALARGAHGAMPPAPIVVELMLRRPR